ncbi:hypothetical protein L6452_03638 [Arctium lappa]|uniref:Uncharacterized protein n=1 Tax=Arctium lappa TaxID=4217 RepID=A0ACB9FPG0_ARCLA|nr:hypothetical protein L6452_03638 [Arctium lappa]
MVFITGGACGSSSRSNLVGGGSGNGGIKQWLEAAMVVAPTFSREVLYIKLHLFCTLKPLTLPPTTILGKKNLSTVNLKMPQVDLETLAMVCGVGGSDRKIACDTLADEPPDPDIPESALVDCPPESFWLSKDAEFDWFDRNAFLDRNESIKGNSNSMNLNLNVNQNHSNANSSSVQFSTFLKSKAAIISLPKAQKTIYVDSKRRNCKLANLWLFPKRSDSLGKEPTVAPMAEPSSPKVSCLGRVRSKRCRSRRKSDAPPEKPAIQHRRIGQVQRSGFISRVKSLFRSGYNGGKTTNQPSLKINQSSECSVPRINVTRNRLNDEQGTPVDPPVLGGVTRFSSGRRSEAWGVTEMLT